MFNDKNNPLDLIQNYPKKIKLLRQHIEITGFRLPPERQNMHFLIFYETDETLFFKISFLECQGFIRQIS